MACFVLLRQSLLFVELAQATEYLPSGFQKTAAILKNGFSLISAQRSSSTTVIVSFSDSSSKEPFFSSSRILATSRTNYSSKTSCITSSLKGGCSKCLRPTLVNKTPISVASSSILSRVISILLILSMSLLLTSVLRRFVKQFATTDEEQTSHSFLA